MEEHCEKDSIVSMLGSLDNGIRRRAHVVRIARTVVRIHIKHATLAPMAAAPEIPPRKADFADLSRISRKVRGVSAFLVAVLIVLGQETLDGFGNDNKLMGLKGSFFRQLLHLGRVFSVDSR